MTKERPPAPSRRPTTDEPPQSRPGPPAGLHSQFDPAKVGRALPVLASELHDELFGPTPTKALLRLKLELTWATLRARAWTEQLDIRDVKIPAPPAPDSDAQECLERLHHLAAVLIALARRRP